MTRHTGPLIRRTGPPLLGAADPYVPDADDHRSHVRRVFDANDGRGFAFGVTTRKVALAFPKV